MAENFMKKTKNILLVIFEEKVKDLENRNVSRVHPLETMNVCSNPSTTIEILQPGQTLLTGNKFMKIQGETANS